MYHVQLASPAIGKAPRKFSQSGAPQSLMREGTPWIEALSSRNSDA